MEIGGAERALLGLLNAIDTNRVDVDLFINQHTGEFMSLIPEKINLLPENNRYATIEKPMSCVLRKGHIDIICARLLAKAAHFLYAHRRDSAHQNDASIFHYVAQYTTPLLPSLSKYGEYDLAISFLSPHNIVVDKVRAKKKIGWIHTDYTISTTNEQAELPVWNSLDLIVSISPDVTTTFLKAFPSLKEKIVEIENILSPTFVREQSRLFKPEDMCGDSLKVCSVGRYSYQKNFESIPFISQILKQRGLKFKWFIIGYGDSRLIMENINKTNTSDCVILLGKKDNPYPYIANCDIYAQPSRYEGKSVTVREAQMLYRPVLVTNYPTAKSQIKDGFDGIICELDNIAIANAIYKLATDVTLCQTLSANLHTQDYGNEYEIKKIYELL